MKHKLGGRYLNGWDVGAMGTVSPFRRETDCPLSLGSAGYMVIAKLSNSCYAPGSVLNT